MQLQPRRDRVAFVANVANGANAGEHRYVVERSRNVEGDWGIAVARLG
jgi:hypothetical protein